CPPAAGTRSRRGPRGTRRTRRAPGERRGTRPTGTGCSGRRGSTRSGGRAAAGRPRRARRPGRGRRPPRRRRSRRRPRGRGSAAPRRPGRRPGRAPRSARPSRTGPPTSVAPAPRAGRAAGWGSRGRRSAGARRGTRHAWSRGPASGWSWRQPTSGTGAPGCTVRERSGAVRVAHAVAGVRDERRRPDRDRLQVEAPDAVEQPDPLTEHDRRDLQRELVDEPGGEIGVGRGGPARDVDVEVTGGLTGAVEAAWMPSVTKWKVVPPSISIGSCG